MYLPGALLAGGPNPATVRPFNELLFVAGLVSIWVGLAAVGYPFLGLLLVMLNGSNPFQLFQAYGTENVFSLPISVALLVLGLHVRLLTPAARADAAAWATAAFTGALLAVVREMRAEPALIGISALATYLTVPRSPVRTRLLLVVLCVATYGVMSAGLRHYFDGKLRDAQIFVERAGGKPYRGPWATHHAAWHPILVGLGDFDQKYGFKWKDRVAYGYAAPILRERYAKAVTYQSPAYYFNETYAASPYRIKPEDFPEYHVIVRDKVLSTIWQDPGWYVRILAQRVGQIFLGDDAARGGGLRPLDELRTGRLDSFALLIATVLARKRLLVGLLLFTLPLVVPAFLFSLKGMTHFGYFTSSRHPCSYSSPSTWCGSGGVIARSPRFGKGVTPSGHGVVVVLVVVVVVGVRRLELDRDAGVTPRAQGVPRGHSRLLGLIGPTFA
jgi:hypothetical protein